MCTFSGTVRIHIIEATDLRPTEYSTRLGNVLPRTLDPYVSIDSDEILLHRTTSKQKCNCPTWNEEFSAAVQEAQGICLTVFHKAAIPPDDFIANCSITFDEILSSPSRDGVHDFWVSLFYFYFTNSHIYRVMCGKDIDLIEID